MTTFAPFTGNHTKREAETAPLLVWNCGKSADTTALPLRALRATGPFQRFSDPPPIDGAH